MPSWRRPGAAGSSTSRGPKMTRSECRLCPGLVLVTMVLSGVTVLDVLGCSLSNNRQTGRQLWEGCVLHHGVVLRTKQYLLVSCEKYNMALRGQQCLGFNMVAWVSSVPTDPANRGQISQ